MQNATGITSETSGFTTNSWTFCGVISMIEQEVFILVRGRKDALCHLMSAKLDPDSRSFPKLRCTKYCFLTITYCWSNNSLLLRKNT